jgi:hypothetical protein
MLDTNGATRTNPGNAIDEPAQNQLQNQLQNQPRK